MENDKNRWQWLKDRLHELGSNTHEFAIKLSWNPARAYGLYSGETKRIPQNKIPTAIKVLKVDLADFLSFNNGETQIPPRIVDLQNPQEDSSLDLDALVFVMTEVEKWQQKNGSVLSIPEKARLISLLYKESLGLSSSERGAKIIDFLKIRDTMARVL